MRCQGCRIEFEPRNGRQRYCARACQKNRSRTIQRDAHVTRFIGIDGEGVTLPNGNHEYVLLSVGGQSLSMNGERLTWREIFPFLYSCFESDPDAAYVGYYLGYDFTQWLRDIPESRARMLLTPAGRAARQRVRSGNNPIPFPVYLEDWEFDMHAGKRFKLRPHDGQKRPWLYVCDAGAFYQSAFLTAIDPSSWSSPIVTMEEYERIERGKAQRSDAILDAAMVEYNTLENEIMGRIMGSLAGGFTRMGIKLRRQQWYGPGQAVQEWLKAIGAPTREDIESVVPSYARDAARKSYFGGWFEIFAHGHIPGTSHEYDINSAYPKIIAELPCLLHGKWAHGFGEPPGAPWQLVHATVSGSDVHAGAMLHRTPHGRVLRPSNTVGWYWQHELDAAGRAGIVDAILVDEWVTYEPCACMAPLREMELLYLQRLQVGKRTPEGRALRLVLNSCYGKMAQSVGKPKFANPVYASLITAGCRAAILDAIASHPAKTRDLLMVATDGVYFRSPHPSLPLSPETLGEWDTAEKRNLTLVMPGIYWDDSTRERVREGGSAKLKSRGIRAADLAACIAALDDQFSRFGVGESWPTVSIPVSFGMVTATQALARGKWDTCGRVDYGGSRILDSNPETKRWYNEAWAFMALADDGGIWRSFPYDKAPDGMESTPYDKRFGEEMRELEALDGITPDGTVQDVLKTSLL